MDVFPAFWQLDGRRVLVVGGGDAAVRKLRLVARTQASISVFASDPIEEIREIAGSDRVFLEQRLLSQDDIDDTVAFAIVATDDDQIARDAVSLLNAARVPVNAVDRTELCDFLIPSIVDRNPIVIGIASGGAAPVLTKNIRASIESLLPERTGALARFAGRFRKAVTATLSDGKARKTFWENFFAGPIAEKVLAGDEVSANEDMIAAINGHSSASRLQGSVTVIELDPSEGDLISLRAIRVLQSADLILYRDRFGATTRELFRRDADRAEIDSFVSAVQQAKASAVDGHRVAILAQLGETPFQTERDPSISVLRHAGPTSSQPAAISA